MEIEISLESEGVGELETFGDSWDIGDSSIIEYMHLEVTQDTLRYLVMASWIVHPVTSQWPLLDHPRHCNYPRHRLPWSRHNRLKGNIMQTLPHIFRSDLFRA